MLGLRPTGLAGSLIALLAAVAPRQASADDGWVSRYPGHVFPLKNDVIELRREHVRLTVDGQAHTKLVFFNATAQDVSLNIGFPALGDCQSPEGSACAPVTKFFRTWVNGQRIKRARRMKVTGRYRRVYAFTATFKAGAETTIEHRYPFVPVAGVSNGEFLYAYALATGAAWKGPIGEAVFEIVLPRYKRLFSKLHYAKRSPWENSRHGASWTNLLATKRPGRAIRRAIGQRVEVTIRGGRRLKVRLRFRSFEPRGDIYLLTSMFATGRYQQQLGYQAGYGPFNQLVWNSGALTGPLTQPGSKSKVADEQLYHLWLAIEGKAPPKPFAAAWRWMSPFFSRFSLSWLDPRDRAVVELLERRRKQQSFSVFSLEPATCAQIDGPAKIRKAVAGKLLGRWPDRTVVRIVGKRRANNRWPSSTGQVLWYQVERVGGTLAQCSKISATTPPSRSTGWTHQNNLRYLAQ